MAIGAPDAGNKQKKGSDTEAGRAGIHIGLGLVRGTRWTCGQTRQGYAIPGAQSDRKWASIAGNVGSDGTIEGRGNFVPGPGVNMAGCAVALQVKAGTRGILRATTKS